MTMRGLCVIIIMFYYAIMAARQNNTVEYTHTNASTKLDIRSVERGICPIVTSTMNELFL